MKSGVSIVHVPSSSPQAVNGNDACHGCPPARSGESHNCGDDPRSDPRADRNPSMRIPIKRGLTLALACAALHAPAAPAQIEPSETPRAFCWAGRPAESCRTFMVAELSGYLPVVSTRYTRRGYHGEITRSMHLSGHGTWEVGAMRNVSPRDAVGAALMVGGDSNGERIAVKARYRRWKSRRSAMDVGAGLMFARRAEPHAESRQPGNLHVPVAGLTGDVALGFTDWVGMGVRGDLLFDADGKPAVGLYGGLKVGTGPGVAVTVLPFIAGALFILAVGAGP